MTLTQTEGAVSTEAAPSAMCSKCGANPRSKSNSWCKPCNAAYAAAYRERTRPRMRTEVRRCEECGTEFTWDSNHAKQKYCSKPCYQKVRHRTRRERGEWRKPQPKEQRRRQSYRARGYGITPEEFDALVEAQGGRCLICGRDDMQLVPDHCHNGGGFRGAICGRCNKGLGQFADNPDWLTKAAEYLKG